MGAHTASQRARAAHAADVGAALDPLRRIVQGLRLSAAHAERETGLSGAQLFVLQQLAEAPAQSLNELALRTRTHQSSVSTVVSRLAARGLVSRRRDAGDARRLLLELTPAGKVLLEGAPETAQTRLIAALERLPRSRLKALAISLDDLVRTVGMGAEPAPLFFEAADHPVKPGRSSR